MMGKINYFLSRFTKQQKLLFGAAVLLFLALVAQTLYINYNKDKQINGTQNTTSNQTTVLSPTPIQSNLTVISTTPADGAKNLPVNEKITVTFNRNFAATEVDFSLLPTLLFATEIKDKNLIVTPQKPYEPGMTYTFVVRFPNSTILPRTYSFTTTGPTQQFLPDTQPSGAFEREENFQRENNPDVFLSNQTPFENEYFSVISEFKTAPSGHFAFQVTSKVQDTTLSKTEFTAWLKSLGLTDAQIATLDIQYL